MDSEAQLGCHESVTHVITLPPCGFQDPFQFFKNIRNDLFQKGNYNYPSIISDCLVCLSSITIPQVLYELSQMIGWGWVDSKLEEAVRVLF